MRGVLLAATVVAGLAGCAASSAPGAGLRTAYAGRAFDRAVIPAMTTVHGVAVNDRFVFVASPGALAVLDRQFNEWLPPYARVDGWPGGAIDFMLADPLDQQAVWWASGTSVFRYRVGSDHLVRAIVVQRMTGAGAAFIDGADPAAGLILRTGARLMRDARGDTVRVNQYVRVSQTGLVEPIDASRVDPRVIGRDARGRPIFAPTAPRYAPETPEQIVERYPAIRGFERLLTQDGSLRTWPVLSGASHPRVSEVWFGTLGGGLFQIDPLFTRGDQRPFGLLSEGAGAVTQGADGVWIGGAGVPGSTRDGLTFTDNGMRAWRWIDGGVANAFSGGRVTDLSVFGSLVWAATTRGVVVVDGQSGRLVRRWDALSGLPHDVALTVEATRDGAWVGTAQGLVFITEDGRGTAGARASAVGDVLAPGRAVRGLTRRGDTLWIASDAGVLALPPGGGEPRTLRAAEADGRLRGRMVAVATADSIVVVATQAGDVLRLHTGTGAVLDPVTYTSATRLGELTSVAIDSATIWVTGSRGAVVIERSTRRERFLDAGREVPGEVLGVALTRDVAWLATLHAIVRLERLPDGMVR